MWAGTRRDFLRSGATGATATGLATTGLGWAAAEAWAQLPGVRPRQDPSVRVLQPEGRVPLSFIIDDSTCLVNLAHFGMPQFAEVWPDRKSYKKPWAQMVREIPDAFVRKFGQWCREHGVKGKYSVVPYPACVGWLDRELPGWSHRQLRDSLELVRTLMMPDWDIHPEMVTHTRVINTKTGRPYEERSPRFITKDLKQGRMVEVIDRGEPAIMVCHWPGIYYDGKETGFRIFQEVVRRVHQRYDHLIWLKLSEIARYWAAKELTRIDRQGGQIALTAPFGAPRFTLSVSAGVGVVPKLVIGRQPKPLRRVAGVRQLQRHTWTRDGNDVVVCFDLPRGQSRLSI